MTRTNTLQQSLISAAIKNNYHACTYLHLLYWTETMTFIFFILFVFVFYLWATFDSFLFVFEKQLSWWRRWDAVESSEKKASKQRLCCQTNVEVKNKPLSCQSFVVLWWKMKFFRCDSEQCKVSCQQTELYGGPWQK